jgi:hypothetical protein
MGTVIKFPRVRRGPNETPAGTADASAVVIILPVVRIERALAAPPVIKARPAKSVTKSSAIKPSATKSPAKSAPGRKRRKRTASTQPAPACGLG